MRENRFPFPFPLLGITDARKLPFIISTSFSIFRNGLYLRFPRRSFAIFQTFFSISFNALPSTLLVTFFTILFKALYIFLDTLSHSLQPSFQISSTFFHIFFNMFTDSYRHSPMVTVPLDSLRAIHARWNPHNNPTSIDPIDRKRRIRAQSRQISRPSGTGTGLRNRRYVMNESLISLLIYHCTVPGEYTRL